MKKFTTKLLMSIIAVAFAFVALGTSTYAWFSMNQTVTASGMEITAKSDTTFLLIKAGHAADADAVQADKVTTATALAASAELLPTAHTDAVTNITTADAAANWYYKTSDDPALYGGAGHESAATALSTLTGYVLVNEFSITVADGSNDLKKLRVGSLTLTTAGDSAVKVLVATSEGSQEFSANDTDDSDNVQLAASVTSASVTYVKVYIYWDGTNEEVFTNGIADLKNTSVVLTFTGDTVTE